MTPREAGSGAKPRRSNQGFILALLVLILALFWRLRESERFGRLATDASPRVVEARGRLLDGEQATMALFRRASPSVVHITTLTRRRDFFSLNVFEIPQGTGSGFVWDRRGHVVTNFHVISGAQAVRVTLEDRSDWGARLVGYEADKDLAVLKIEAPAERLHPITVGESANLAVGQYVYAIGNPFGLDQTLTTGVISGLGREIQSVTRRPIQGVIQIDAVINPGNSGGPLLDSAGRLIGINTAIYSPSGTSVGIGFAVPVDTVNRIVPQLIRYGKARRPGLGIRIVEDYLVRRLGLEGVLVYAVVPGGAGDQAGLHPTRRDRFGQVLLGDLIIAIDGRTVRNSDDLYKALDPHAVGDTVQVTIRRGGKRLTRPVTLQAIE